METSLHQVIIFFVISIIINEVSPACNKLHLHHGKAILFTEPYNKIQYKCDPGFQMFGASISFCLGGVWNTPAPTCHASGCDPTGYSSLPNGEVDTVSQNSLLMVKCNPGYIMDGESIISCDGHRWSEPLPHCYPAVDINQCDFEYKSLCGWTQDKEHDSNWRTKSGETTTKRTGPRHDHTLGQGHYLYMESSVPNRPGHKSRLLSPVYPWYKSRRCFQLWYHMLGPDEIGYMGELEILLRSGQNPTEQQLLVISGNHGDEWHRAKVFIEEQPNSFQILVQATRGLSHTADIAIDDFKFYRCTNDTDLENMYFESATSIVTENNTSVSHDEIISTSKNIPDITMAVLDATIKGSTERADPSLLRKRINNISETGRELHVGNRIGHYTESADVDTNTNIPKAKKSSSDNSTAYNIPVKANSSYKLDKLDPKKRLTEILSSDGKTKVLTENVAIFPVEIGEENKNMLDKTKNPSSTSEYSETTTSETTNEPAGLKVSAFFHKPEYLVAIAGTCVAIALSVVIVTVLILKRRTIWGRKKSDDQLTVLYTKTSETYSSI